MENTLADILSLIHTRETALQDELKKLDETKRLLTPRGEAQDTGRPANGKVNAADSDAIPEVGGGWSAARRQRHSRMMKKRWAARKRAKQSKQ